MDTFGLVELNDGSLKVTPKYLESQMESLAIANIRTKSLSAVAAVAAVPNASGRKLRSINIQDWRRRMVRFLVGGWRQTGGASAPVGGSIPRQSLYRVLVCRPNHRLGNLLLLTAQSAHRT